MSKKDFSEADICAKFITPAVLAAGWSEQTQIQREVYFTNGQIHVRGKMVTRGKRKFADYVLYYKPNIPIAIIEAKDNNHGVADGMQQALEYAEILNIPFVFSSNGDGFVFRDRTGASAELESSLSLNAFPRPEVLWQSYRQWKGLSPEVEELVLQDYFDDGSGREPRYYQRNAINAATEAIAKGQDRVLLVMATGTGKTYTAFQIIWRLWKGGRKKRVLYLADRNVLIDQTMVNDFRPFKGAMAKLSTGSKTIEADDGSTAQIAKALDSKRRIDTSYEIYLGLYQALTGPDERQKLFREFSPGFFDLIVVDECHRGSADDDAAWREILEYFSAATQIGLTATPKETKYGDIEGTPTVVLLDSEADASWRMTAVGDLLGHPEIVGSGLPRMWVLSVLPSFCPLALGLAHEPTRERSSLDDEEAVQSEKQQRPSAHLYAGARPQGGAACGTGDRQDAEQPTWDDRSPGPEPSDSFVQGEDGDGTADGKRRSGEE